jgi:hypothetical protein
LNPLRLTDRDKEEENLKDPAILLMRLVSDCPSLEMMILIDRQEFALPTVQYSNRAKYRALNIDLSTVQRNLLSRLRCRLLGGGSTLCYLLLTVKSPMTTNISTLIDLGITKES